MKKDELDLLLKRNNYLQGGTKEACIKIREFLMKSTMNMDTIHSPSECITSSDFVEAVRVLMASVSQKEDEIPKRWLCDSDCRNINNLFCKGMFSLDYKSQSSCPYFVDDGLV